ncbi:MAG TPA: RHS repeat-associated core domain-containing protein, partial [Tahibacter sp.]|nr:RHS repeat-associated core domain-containing protein [Tahibacter sp.]
IDGAWLPGASSVAGHWRHYEKKRPVADEAFAPGKADRSGVVLYGQVRRLDDLPLAGVEVSIGEARARTDADGAFVLENPPAGKHGLLVDGSTANTATAQYGQFVVAVDVGRAGATRVDAPIYLPRIRAEDKIAIPSPTTRETVLTHPEIPGMALHIPAGTVIRDHHGRILTELAIVPTPSDRAPANLPANFPVFFTVQPGGARVEALTEQAAAGISVVYPNYDKSPSGAPYHFFAYDVDRGGWTTYGQGKVTDDGLHIVADAGVRPAIGVMPFGASLVNGDTPPDNPQPCGCAGGLGGGGGGGGGGFGGGGPGSGGDPVDLRTGVFYHEWPDFTIRDILPLTFTRSYRTFDPVSRAFGVGGTHSYAVYLFNPTGSSSNISSPVLVLPSGSRLPFTLKSGAGHSSIFVHTASASAFYGAELRVPDSSYWLMTLRDGTEYRFNQATSRLASVSDRFGNKTELTYDAGLLSTIRSPSGRYVRFDYDASNRIHVATDNTGRTVTYGYVNGRLDTVTYPDLTQEHYAYDANGRMHTDTDARNNVVFTNTYDANGRVSQQTLADNAPYQFAYTLDGNNVVTRADVTDPNNRVRRVVFHATGYPTTDTYPYGDVLAQTYTFERQAGSGLITAVVDPLSRRTELAYDVLGNVTSLTRLAGTPDAVSRSATYTEYSQVSGMWDENGSQKTFEYSRGCMTRATGNGGRSTTVVCNGDGQPASITDSLQHTIAFAYDGHDMRSVTDALGRTGTSAYDALGRLVSTRRADGGIVRFEYDSRDRLVKRYNGLNDVTEFHYDAVGNLASVEDPRSGVNQFAYDPRNRRTGRTDPLNQTETWTYDGLGNLLTHTDRNGQLTQFGYDALSRRTVATYDDGTTSGAQYDAGNRPTELSDSGNDASLTRTYDALDRLLSESSGLGSVEYTYDAAGRRTSMTAGGQATVNYTYNNEGDVWFVESDTESVQYFYDLAGRRVEERINDSLLRTYYEYDAANQLTHLIYKRNVTCAQQCGTTLGDLAYAYDNGGRRVTTSGSWASDALPAATDVDSVYDANNRQAEFNGANFVYDANGSLVSDMQRLYVWDVRGRLASIKNAATAKEIASFDYDVLDRRIVRRGAKGSQPRITQYDGLNPIVQIVDGTVNPLLQGGGLDQIVARNEFDGRRVYYLRDGAGSVVALVDGLGQVVQRYHYEPYGEVVEDDTTTGFDNPYKFSGREADPSGLYYFRARYYDPAAKRFISEDPLGLAGGLNGYSYVRGRPMDRVDPLGLQDMAVCALSAGSVGCGSFAPSDFYPPPPPPSACDCHWLPDYYSLDFFWGYGSFSLIVTRYFDVFVSPGLVGPRSGFQMSGSANFMLTCAASRDQLNGFLGGWSVGGSAYDIVGGGGYANPSGASVGVGVGIGASGGGNYGVNTGAGD